MNQPKLAIVYYSATGTNYKVASAMKDAAEQVGAKVRLRKVRELAPASAIDKNPDWRAHHDATQDTNEATLEDLEWADAYIFGSPTRFGNISSQLKQFIDTSSKLWFKGIFTNKVVAGFTSASNDHGGQETTLLALYNTFYHWGCIIVPPGYTDDSIAAAGGNPYGMSVTAHRDTELPASTIAAAHHLVKRVLMVARWTVAGYEAETARSTIS